MCLAAEQVLIVIQPCPSAAIGSDDRPQLAQDVIPVGPAFLIGIEQGRHSAVVWMAECLPCLNAAMSVFVRQSDGSRRVRAGREGTVWIGAARLTTKRVVID